LLIKYIKSVLWRVAKRLSYIEEARFLKVNALSRRVAEPQVRSGYLGRPKNRFFLVNRTTIFRKSCP